MLFGLRVASMLGVLSLSLSLSAAPVLADDDAPAKPKIDCKKPENKNKPACKGKSLSGAMSDDEIVNAAYWLAREGQYKDALGVLDGAANKEHPRVLTATGFATRKLGNVDAALPLYVRALEVDPNYVQARGYLGEAYLTKGDVVRAAEQLGEIEKRCGKSCPSYSELKSKIVAFEAGGARYDIDALRLSPLGRGRTNASISERLGG